MRSGRHLLALGAAAALLFSAWTSAALAQPTTNPPTPFSAELVEHPKKYDGKRVTFTGEAVGEAMKRGSYAWLHLNDGPYSDRTVDEGAAHVGYNSGQAVWAPAEFVGRVGTFGDYTHHGDIVTVEGVFNAACEQHGGDMDIHAITLRVDSRGRRIEVPVLTVRLVLAFGMALASAGLWAVQRRRATRMRLFR